MQTDRATVQQRQKNHREIGEIREGRQMVFSRTSPISLCSYNVEAGLAFSRRVLRWVISWPTLDVVKRPFVNVEEPIERVVGRRTRTADPLSVHSGTRADAVAWREAFGGIRVARGVYRFRTHEEADAWLWRTIARPATT
jgi:hypothetical protein